MVVSARARPAQPELMRFSRTLDAYPAAFHGNPLNLLFVDDAMPIDGERDYLRRIDGPGLLNEQRQYCLEPHTRWPFPSQTIDQRPDPWTLSQRLFDDFGLAERLLTKQDDVAAIVAKRAIESRPDVVALIIVDGLSYYDLPADTHAEPCLVTGVTTTEHGYRAAIGKPSLSRRMFALGYKSQVAYTYYRNDLGTLSGDLHAEFAPSQVRRVREFAQVSSEVAAMPPVRTYLQVTLSGLDHLCHSHPDRPHIEEYRDGILGNLHQLHETLVGKGRTAMVTMVADHGILWRSVLEPRLEIADDLTGPDRASPRYIVGRRRRSYGICRSSEGRNYTLFGVPFMSRSFRNNEWGVHGGVSAWESLVPLVILE